MSQVGAVCYASDDAAVSAMASAEVGRVVSLGSVSYVVDASPASSTSILYTLTPIGGGDPITSTVVVTVQPCGLMDWSDGLALGWGVAGVWLATFAVLAMRKAKEGGR